MTHQNAYVWNLNNVNTQVQSGATLTSAVLTFFNFANWTTAGADPSNVLWVDLFNSAAAGRNGDGQVSSISDNTNGSTLSRSDVLDGFRYTGGTNTSALSAVNGTGVYLGSSTNTYLEAQTTPVVLSKVNGYNPTGTADALGNNQPLTGGTGAFSTTPVTWTLTITDTGVLASLASYINNGGDIALGLDADCHFSDTSIQFQIFGNPPSGGGAAAVPEPATLMLVGSGIAAAYRRRRKAVAV
jgi:hypothetical protein